MKNFLKIADGIDVSGVNAELAAAPDLWDQHTIRKVAPGTPHSQMSDIWVRYNDVRPYEASGDYTGFNDPHIPIWYPAWYRLPSLHPIVRRLNAAVNGDMIGGILITRIPPGAAIEKHVDRSWHVDYFDKFYLSLSAAPGAEFWCEHDGVTEALCPQVGEIWRFDNHKMHWVTNTSSVDRVTAIICIHTDMFKGLP